MQTAHTVEERRAFVRAWTESGLSARRFAASRGLSYASLQRWKAGETSRRTEQPVRPVDFVRLVQARPSPTRGLVVEIAGARIQVDPGFDAGLLASVVAALRGAS